MKTECPEGGFYEHWTQFSKLVQELNMTGKKPQKEKQRLSGAVGVSSVKGPGFNSSHGQQQFFLIISYHTRVPLTSNVF
jgi:hypothetical protein